MPITVEFKSRIYEGIGEVPIPTSSHWCNAQSRNKFGEVPIVRTRLNGTTFVVYENMLFPTRESFEYANLLGHIVKATIAHRNRPLPFVVVDVGTGVGTNAIEIAKLLQDEQRQGLVVVVATELDGAALSIADNNAQLNNIAGIRFRKGSILEGVRREFGRVDLITSNPPWYPSKEAQRKCNSYQPLLAIDGGDDGLEFYRALFEEAKDILSDDGLIAVRTQDQAWIRVYRECQQALHRPQTIAINHFAFLSGIEDRKRKTGLLHGNLDLFDIENGYHAYINSKDIPPTTHSRKLLLENVS